MTGTIRMLLASLIVCAGCGHVAPAGSGDGSADTDAPDTTDLDGSTDAEDTAGDTPTDTMGDTAEDTSLDGVEDTAGDAPEDTVTDVPVCTSDLDCTGGTICRPTCFGGDGCGLAPSSLVIDCPVDTRPDAVAPCDIALDGLEDQVACLDCTTEVGMVTLSRTDFNNSGGICFIDGWSLVTGDSCTNTVTGCTLADEGQQCCAVPSTLLTTLGGDCMLRSDRNLNCSADEREVRARRGVDTTGVGNVEVCFDIAESGADANEGIFLLASDGSHDEQVWCLNGPPTPGDRDVNDFEWPVCVDLPGWAADNPDLELTFVMHSHDNNDAVYLDDILVRGWPLSCTPSRIVAFEEDFEPCAPSDPIADGWNGWAVTGTGGPACEDRCTGGSAGGASVLDGQWTMTHAVDASALQTDVRLCFDVGGDRCNAGEMILVSFDAGDGTGLQEAWYWEQEWGPDGTCQRVCVLLSEIDPDVLGEPSLLISFQLTSDDGDRWVFIDDVVVDGAGRCDGAGVVDVGAISDGGSGDYSFDLTDIAGGPAPVWVTCSWDSPTPPVEDTEYTIFE